MSHLSNSKFSGFRAQRDLHCRKDRFPGGLRSIGKPLEHKKLLSDQAQGPPQSLSAIKHQDHVLSNVENTPTKSEDGGKPNAKEKNVPIEFADLDDFEADVTNLHRKILHYCDLNGQRGNKFLDWIDCVDCRNPKIKASLIKTSDNYPGGTLLHAIARGPQQKEHVLARFEKRYELLKWICENHPVQYTVKDHDDRTVLEEIILKSRQSRTKDLNPFAEFFVKRFPAETARQLNEQSDNGDLVLHLLPMVCNRKVQDAGCLGAILPYLNEETLRHADEDGNTVLHLAARYNYACDEKPNSQQLLKEQLENLLQRYPNLICALNKNKESPYLHRVNTARDHTTNEGDNPLALKPDVVTYFLKVLCMNRCTEEAVSLMYGPWLLGPGHQTSLNLKELSRGRRTITNERLIKFLDRFHFEVVLQFVQIPSLTLASEKPAPSTTVRPPKLTRRNTALTDGIGREEYLVILSYLREKGVRKIFELIVDDDQDPPHKDTIIVSLEKFDIEIFDWKKLDLCSDTIFKAAPYAHKIVLYSSGNNAVLKSWSAADGLARFLRLTEVHVYVRQRIESTATTKEMIKQFRERMSKNCTQVSSGKLITHLIQTTKEDLKSAGAIGNAPGSSETVSLYINTWMSTMKRFARFIVNIPETEFPSGRRPIKVAVIDDGIDLAYVEEHLSQAVKGGESFCAGLKRLPYFFSSTGHGTLMADLVQQICPFVHLYVARLDEVWGESKVQPTTESAAKAIKWAIEQDVDIISMSWTITSKYEHILRPVIQEADRKNILMFGAASDQGYNAASKAYPAEYEQVFCIGAAKSTGEADPAARLQAQYVFPGGECSEMKAEQRTTDPSLNPAWGSSFATALASGLAALILDCSEIIGYGDSHREIIRTRGSMNTIFSEMIREKDSKYIPVTQYFPIEVSTCEWDTEGKQKFRKAVKNILRELIRSLNDVRPIIDD